LGELISSRNISPSSLEVISRQATINIGIIGHVAHGKSTLAEKLSGVKTMTHTKELAKNITIKLGYANCKIYKSAGVNGGLDSYFSGGSALSDEFVCPEGKLWKLERHISLVDCPGHDMLMATMLNGCSIMDSALLLIAANDIFPQPQTQEHLVAADIMKLKNVIIIQNKIDRVKRDVAEKQAKAIKEFVSGTVAESAPIIPISAHLGYNIDSVLEHVVKCIPVPIRNLYESPRMMVVRSFDVNKPGTKIDKLKGGVAGGSIMEGVFQVNSLIEIRPGIVERDESGSIVGYIPIKSRIKSIFAEKNELQYAIPGGLIAMGTEIDSILTRNDRLVGQVIGLPGQLPDVFTEIEISYELLFRLLGNEESSKVKKLSKGEVLMLNVGSQTVPGSVVKVLKSSSGSLVARLALHTPVCVKLSEKIAISRKINESMRLIGWGQIRRGTVIQAK